MVKNKISYHPLIHYYCIPVAWSEYSRKMRPLVVCRAECPWQTKALMTENLYLEIQRELIHRRSILLLLSQDVEL